MNKNWILKMFLIDFFSFFAISALVWKTKKKSAFILPLYFKMLKRSYLLVLIACYLAQILIISKRKNHFNLYKNMMTFFLGIIHHMFNKYMQNENNYFVILFGFCACIFGHSLTRMHDELFMNSDCERRGERKTVNGECTVRERQTHAERTESERKNGKVERFRDCMRIYYFRQTNLNARLSLK